MDITSSATSATNREYKRIVMSTKEGENRVMVVDLNTFMPGLLYPHAQGTLSGTDFSPSYVWCNPRETGQNKVDGLVLDGGKCRIMASGLIGNDVYSSDPLDYNFGEDGVSPSLVLKGHFMAGFDQKNERIRIFGNNLQGGGMFTMHFDHLVNPEKTKGHHFLAVTEMFTDELKWQFLTHKGNEVFMHHVIMDINNYPYSVKEVITKTSKSVPEMIDAVHFVFSGQYWYFAKGRTIYQCSPNGLDVAVYLTLPDDGSGDITAWNFNADGASNFKKMGIATYNAASTADRKGSYYLYDLASKKFNQQDLYVIDKAVDIEIGL